MKPNIDYIYVPKADINEGISSGTITKAALYFTKEYLFVLPFESLLVLLATTETRFNNIKEYVTDLNKQLPDLDTPSFHNLLLSMLKEERIYKISELEKFSIQVGVWIFGGMRLKKKGGPLQSINIQPKALREQLKMFYSL
ncbi:MAG: hypothetical protein HC831_27570 [Chloroflexia bacterium]|nr:hypothetical protein [Chloroflexia bacterium]